jgi:hypothetical protein
MGSAYALSAFHRDIVAKGNDGARALIYHRLAMTKGIAKGFVMRKMPRPYKYFADPAKLRHT